MTIKFSFYNLNETNTPLIKKQLVNDNIWFFKKHQFTEYLFQAFCVALMMKWFFYTHNM